MSELCAATGEDCRLLGVFHDVELSTLVANARNPRISQHFEYFTKEHEAKLLGQARRLCTPEECGILRLGSIIALKLLAVEQAKTDINPNI